MASTLAHNLETNTKYLKDDTLYFRVSVEVDGLKPWLKCMHSKVNRNFVLMVTITNNS
jgi:hypothetical protein